MQCTSSITSRPMFSNSCGITSLRNVGLLSRSGEISSRSISPAAIRSKISCQSSRFVELTVSARMPSRSAISSWLRISTSRGETITVGPEALFAQHLGGNEVDGRFPPSGALHHKRPAPLDSDHLDGLELAVTELGGRIGGELSQMGERSGSEVRHRLTLWPGCDTWWDASSRAGPIDPWGR